eukprot:12856432-Ditylum_brightwellii.AAC.1
MAKCGWSKTCAISSGHIFILWKSSRTNNPSNPQQTGHTAVSTNGEDGKGRDPTVRLYAHISKCKTTFFAGDMQLAVDSDAAYLVLPGAKRRFAGHFYLQSLLNDLNYNNVPSNAQSIPSAGQSNM